MSEYSSKLHGNWRLVSLETERQDTKQRTQPWGADPNGHLVLGPNGRMMVLVTAKVRTPGDADEKLAALFRTMMADTGWYRIDGDRLVTQIDASWNETWSGTEQERFYKLDDNKLEVTTAWMANPLDSGKTMGRGILRFIRE